MFNYRYHRILEVELTRALILQLANFQLLSKGSFGSGLLGNPIGRLHFCNFHHPIHPWHKFLDWSPPKSKKAILWEILDLKIKIKDTLVREKLFRICRGYLQPRWNFLGRNQSSQWSLKISHFSLLKLLQRSFFLNGKWNSHVLIFLFSWLVLV